VRTLRCLVVDDERLARQRVRSLALEAGGLDIVGEAASGAEAVEGIDRLRPDLVFLDIALPDMDGFAVLNLVKKVTPAPLVIFMTAYDQHAVRAFALHAADYLLKPTDATRFIEAVDHARSRLGPGHEPERGQAVARTYRLAVRKGDRVVFLTPQEIDSVEALGNYVKVRRGREHFMLRCTLAALEERLRGFGFVRVRRSALVNVEGIMELRRESRDAYVIVLKSGALLRLSPRYRRNLEEALGAF
jgi:two-component system LytT family response regulator